MSEIKDRPAGRAVAGLINLSDLLDSVRNLLTELTPDGRAESEAAKVVAGLIGAGNPYGFTDALKSACASVCGNFGEPPCWQIPENDDPAHFTNPCGECRAKVHGYKSLTFQGIQSEMDKWVGAALTAKNPKARSLAEGRCSEVVDKARRAGFELRNPFLKDQTQ